jgi:hypothetical protein
MMVTFIIKDAHERHVHHEQYVAALALPRPGTP